LNENDKKYFLNLCKNKIIQILDDTLPNLDDYEDDVIDLVATIVNLGFNSFDIFKKSKKHYNKYELCWSTLNKVFENIAKDNTNDLNLDFYKFINELIGKNSMYNSYDMQNDCLDNIIKKGRFDQFLKIVRIKKGYFSEEKQTFFNNAYIKYDFLHIIKKDYRFLADYEKYSKCDKFILKYLFDACVEHKDDFWLNIVIRQHIDTFSSYKMLKTLEDCRYWKENEENDSIISNQKVATRVEHNILLRLRRLYERDYVSVKTEDGYESEEVIIEPIKIEEEKILIHYKNFFQYSGYWHEYYAEFEQSIKFDLRLSPHVLHSHLICAKEILEKRIGQYIPEIVHLILIMAC
jgi:hypothetical protein